MADPNSTPQTETLVNHNKRDTIAAFLLSAAIGVLTFGKPIGDFLLKNALIPPTPEAQFSVSLAVAAGFGIIGIVVSKLSSRAQSKQK